MAKKSRRADPDLTALIDRLREQEQETEHRYRLPMWEIKYATKSRTEELTLRNWITRKQLNLDGIEAQGSGRLRLSTRDLLFIGFALRLSKCGLSPSKASGALSMFANAISKPSHFLASNRTNAVWVSPNGETLGPLDLGRIEDFERDTFIIVRIDKMSQEILEPIGYATTFGDADEMRKAADRLAAARTDSHEANNGGDSE